MTTYVHRCMIVPADWAPLARNLSAAAAGPAGEGTWVVPLSATGLPPATHFISTGPVEDVIANLLDDPYALHTAVEGAVDLPTCTALLEACDITDQQPAQALDRLGLRLIVEGDPAG